MVHPIQLPLEETSQSSEVLQAPPPHLRYTLQPSCCTLRCFTDPAQYTFTPCTAPTPYNTAHTLSRTFSPRRAKQPTWKCPEQPPTLTKDFLKHPWKPRPTPLQAVIPPLQTAHQCDCLRGLLSLNPKSGYPTCHNAFQLRLAFSCRLYPVLTQPPKLLHS